MAAEKQPDKKSSLTDVPNEVYNSVFNVNADGKKILTELMIRYYDRPSYTKGDPHDTARKEGQREVVFHILQKIGQVMGG